MQSARDLRIAQVRSHGIEHLGLARRHPGHTDIAHRLIIAAARKSVPHQW
jgi:hypothetical protein